MVLKTNSGSTTGLNVSSATSTGVTNITYNVAQSTILSHRCKNTLVSGLMTTPRFRKDLDFLMSLALGASCWELCRLTDDPLIRVKGSELRCDTLSADPNLCKV